MSKVSRSPCTLGVLPTLSAQCHNITACLNCALCQEKPGSFLTYLVFLLRAAVAGTPGGAVMVAEMSFT